MSLNTTPAAERVHIGLFGKRNAGKSSVINAITGQNLAIVSNTKGTTTDPVFKAMELLPIGPVMLIDTPGLDDIGELGLLRMQKAYQALNKTDIALLIIDSQIGFTAEDNQILAKIKEKQIPYLIVLNKIDLGLNPQLQTLSDELRLNTIKISTANKSGIQDLKEKITKLIPSNEPKNKLVGDLLAANDLAILVVPIDSSAPKGRLILPQQQTIRDILEVGGTALVVRETELKTTLANIGKTPKIVITDSQAFAQVAKETPSEILLTSFSILFARYKGDLAEAIKGARALETLKDGDTILIAEGCTHHRQCGDIGTVKLPHWLTTYTHKKLNFAFCSGTEFPLELSSYKMIIHCGGCMLNEREMKYRIHYAVDHKLPITNYGIAIAYMQGILKRSIQAFPELTKILE